MQRLILARHTEKSDGVDPPLTELGRAQAIALAERLRQLGAEIILCSTMLRAQQTADIVAAELGLKIHSSAALNEYALRDDGSGVESTDQAIARATTFLNGYRPYFRNVLIVGHASMNRTIAWSMLNLNWEQMQTLPSDYGSAMVLDYTEQRGWSWQPA